MLSALWHPVTDSGSFTLLFLWSVGLLGLPCDPRCSVFLSRLGKMKRRGGECILPFLEFQLGRSATTFFHNPLASWKWSRKTEMKGHMREQLTCSLLRFKEGWEMSGSPYAGSSCALRKFYILEEDMNRYRESAAPCCIVVTTLYQWLLV